MTARTSDAPAPSGYVFGPFEVDLSTGELRKFGVRIRLERKPWQLLVVLLGRPGELVDRSELTKALWGDSVFVDFEHGLNVAVRKVRTALSDSADSPRFLQTVAGEGYRFLAEVTIQYPKPKPPMVEETVARPWSADTTKWVIASALLLCLAGWIGLVRFRRLSKSVTSHPPRLVAQIRRFVYVADYSQSAILGYTVDPIAGVLKPLAVGPFKTGEHPYGGAISPDRDFVYMVNRGRADGVCGKGCTLSEYAIDGASGSLTEVDGSPIAAGAGPVAVAIHPSKRFVYVANVISNDVYAYLREETGNLSRIASVPVGTHPFALTVSPTGDFLYVANQDDATISAFKIDSNGALNTIAGSPFPTGLRPRSFTIEPRGRFAFVVNYGVNPYKDRDTACSGVYGTVSGRGCTISVYSINSRTGSLTEIKGSPFQSDGTNPINSVIDGEGKYLFVANITSNNLSVYRVNHNTGGLEPVNGSPFATGYGPTAAALDWDDSHLYVTNAYSANISQFEVDADTGQLRTLADPLKAGLAPAALVAER